MKTLYIVRHAKSSWEYEGIKDIDRPLKQRGINDAYLISNVLQKKLRALMFLFQAVQTGLCIPQ